MKIKIIDLVTKWLNADEMPKKIKYNDSIFEYDEFEEDYMPEESHLGLLDMVATFSDFNDEVEIIEEKPTVEKLEDRIERAVEFLETQHNTYPSGEMWRGALKNILEGKNADDVYESFIEENKKIEKIEEKPDTILYEFNDYNGILEDALDWNFKVIEDKVNILSDALIDVVNKLKE